MDNFMNNEKEIENFVNQWFGNQDEVKPTQQSKSTNRLTEEEIDRAFEEINKVYAEALENAHKSGKYR